MKEKLRKVYETYMKVEPASKPGEMLEWKPGMRDRYESGPFIFMAKIQRECFVDAVVCSLKNEDFIRTVVDSRRLQRVKADKDETVSGMTFGEAIEAMKKEHSVGRASWDKGDFICLSGDILYNGMFLWEAEQEDLLAEDWLIVEKGE